LLRVIPSFIPELTVRRAAAAIVYVAELLPRARLTHLRRRSPQAGVGLSGSIRTLRDMNEPSDRDPYEEQIRRLRRILGPQFMQFRQIQRLHAPVIRAMLGTDFTRRNNELMRLFTGSAARSAVSPLFARNEELRKALTAGTRTVRLFDPKAMETFRLLNPPSFTTAFSKFAAPGITEAMRGFHDFRRPLITEQLKPLLERFRETWERSLPRTGTGATTRTRSRRSSSSWRRLAGVSSGLRAGR
jgi:hypothetical protein